LEDAQRNAFTDLGQMMNRLEKGQLRSRRSEIPVCLGGSSSWYYTQYYLPWSIPWALPPLFKAEH